MIIPTRTVRYEDGTVELVRLQNSSMPEKWDPNDPLPFESSLVWVLPVDGLDYVRVAVIHNSQTRGGPLLLQGEVVLAGYSRLAADAPAHPRTHAYTRRVFYLTLEDGRRNLNDLPPTAVDPSSLLPGQPGSVPDISRLSRGYPRHIRRRRRSVVRHPVSLAPILVTQHSLQLAAS